MGHPVKDYRHGAPVVGDMINDPMTMTMKIWTGQDWYELTSEDLSPNLSEIELRWQNRRQITDEYLEEQYPDLKPLREAYLKY